MTATQTDWSAARYLAFEDERTRPARDLLAQVPLDGAARAVDMGCGPGNSTELLVERFGTAAVSGFDTSPDMLAKARARLPGIAFEQADLATWQPDGEPDLLFANAVLQWVPDHVAVVVRLARTLRPGGYLAVQMPDNLDEPSHAEMRAVAASDPRWAARLARAADARDAVVDPGVYYDALQAVCARVEVWVTVYHHVLEGPGAIARWFETTGLRPFLNPLSQAEQADFLAAYTDRMAQAYPAQADGRVLLRLPRLFVVARR